MRCLHLLYFIGLFLFSLFVPVFGWGAGPSLMEVADKLMLEKKYEAAAENYELAIAALEERGEVENLLTAYYHFAKCKVHYLDFEGALIAFEKMESRAKAHGENQMQAAALDAQISILNHYSRNEETERKCRTLLALENVSEDLYSNAHLILGHILTMQGESQKGFAKYLEAYRIDSMRQDSSSLPFLLSLMGNNLRGQGNYSLALEYILQASSWIRKQDSFKLSEIYCDLGIIFSEMHNPVIAQEYFSKAKQIAETYDQKSQINELLYYEAQGLYGQDQITLAEQKILAAADGFVKRKNDPLLFKCFNSLIKVSLRQKDFKKAKLYLEKADSIKVFAGREDLEIVLLNNYASYYFLKKDWGKTNLYLQQALNKAESLKHIGIKSRTFNLANKYYHAIGDDKRAYRYRDEFDVLKDSMNALQRTSLVYQMEAVYKKTQQDLEIAKLDLANRKKSEQLSSQKRAIVFGGIGLVGLVGLGILGFSLYRTKQQAATKLEEKNKIISSSLADKELLLKEIHHRVKNNLQVISSLLSLQSDYIKDDSALSAIQEGRDRVKSMALIHQNLYQEDNLTGIEVKTYFEKLAKSLFTSYNVKPKLIKMELNVEEINLDVDTVIPLGLVVNELISNSLKYAFPNDSKGLITIELKEMNNTLFLRVADDGVGFDASKIDEGIESFGYQIIQAFKEKLDADLRIEAKNGTSVELSTRDYLKAV